MSLEEEYQMQMAMALSASANGDCVGHLDDGDQIRKAKLMSLNRFSPHRDEGRHTAESLSRRYWVRLPTRNDEYNYLSFKLGSTKFGPRIDCVTSSLFTNLSTILFFYSCTFKFVSWFQYLR
jgi:hypothetical protein